MESYSHMTFFWSKDSEILFSGWPGSRAGMYALAIIVVFVVTVLVEWLSHSRWMTMRGPRNALEGTVQTAIYTVRIGLGYLLMLAVMSFNGGVFIAVIAAHAVRFTVFASRVFNEREAPAKYTVCC